MNRLFHNKTPLIHYRLTKQTSVVFLVFGALFLSFDFKQLEPNANIKPDQGIRKVVIDAGHGGRDPGNLGTGRYKTKEKHIALAVSLKFGEYIEKEFKDVEVIYTRKTDVSITLQERTRIANESRADLFISIHCNSSDDNRAYGADTFVMGLDKTEANMRVAKKENAAMLLEDDYETTYQGFDPSSDESLIALSLAQNVFLVQSVDFAAKVQKQFKERVGRRDRGVKQAPYWVISRTIMPSILVEVGFLTNSQEEDFLQSQQGQVYMASALFRAFKEYKKEIDGRSLSVGDARLSEDNLTVEEPKNTGEANIEQIKAQDNETKTVELLFKVQFASSSNQVVLKPENFKGLEDVQEYKIGSIFKYMTGNCKDLSQATALQTQVRKTGYKDAFVVAFNEGERIAVSEAIKLQNKLNK